MAKQLCRKAFEVEQQLILLKWTYTEAEMLKRIKSIAGLKSYAFIVHDKDKHADGSPVEPHFDCVLTFDNAHTADSVAKVFGVPVQQVSSIKGTTADAQFYLIHGNAPEKYQYPIKAVSSSFPFGDFAEKKKAEFLKKNSMRNVLALIANETIKPYNLYDYITIEEYANNKLKFERAFEYVQARKKGVERDMECVYIYGAAGVGKTTFAKQYAKSLNYSVYVSSGGRNPLDDYKGQECIILDDIRSETFPFADFLKLTDNNTDSLVGCRYYNKSISYCKLIICTSVCSIKNLFGAFEGEPLLQVYRRFQNGKGIMKLDKDQVHFMQYDDTKNDLVEYSTCNNPVALMFDKVKALEFATSVMNSMGLKKVDGTPAFTTEELLAMGFEIS